MQTSVKFITKRMLTNFKYSFLKFVKIRDFWSILKFVECGFSIYGGQHAMELVSEIGRRLSEVNHEPQSTSLLRQRLAVAVQRGNASCIIGTLQVNCSMNKQ